MWGLNFFLGIPHWVIYCSWTIHQKIYLCGVSWWLSRVRIWCCHWSSLDHCCGVGWIPDLGTSTGCRRSKKKKKRKYLFTCSLRHFLSYIKYIYTIWALYSNTLIRLSIHLWALLCFNYRCIKSLFSIWQGYPSLSGMIRS